MTAIPAVPSEPPLTDEAALSDAELAEALARHGKYAGILAPIDVDTVPRLVASLRSARKELEAARVVTTLYAWTGGGQETERELALFQAWHEYVITYGTPNPSDEWDQRIADLAARRRARQAEVRAGLAKIVTTEEGASRG